MTFTDPNPIGTGPYTLDTFSPQVYTYKANPTYWQAGKISVKKIQFPTVSANSFDSLLGQGRLDWSGGFVAHVDQIFVNKDKAHNQYWYPADGLVNLVSNLKRAPLDSVPVRKAISTAIDRAALSKVAALGYETAASPTGLVRPARTTLILIRNTKIFSSRPTRRPRTRCLTRPGYARARTGSGSVPAARNWPSPFSYRADSVTGSRWPG